MTCIVGIVDKQLKRVVIGGDSAASNSNNIYIRKDPKVFKNGEFIFGCTTSYRMIQLLRFSFTPPEIKHKDIFEYMCTDFINEVRECFKNGGYLQRESDGDERGGFFLVGYKNRLFRIEHDFQVGENLNGIDSCGCGGDFALGALIALQHTSLLPNKKALIALEASAFLSQGVSKPFILIST